MIINVIIVFLAVSIVFYCLFGGADFGGGILELFAGNRKKTHRKVLKEAMGPVWEANHVWLILAVVILFNGFPDAFRQFSITFHIPLTILLVGIVLRGTAFAFRHYDPSESMNRWYSAIFSVSSIIAPFMFGMIIGAMLLGRTSLTPATFYEGYIMPWLNLFSFSTGLFVTALFTMIAAIYLIGETQDPDMIAFYRRRARQAVLASVIIGGLVYGAAFINEFNFLIQISLAPLAVLCVLFTCILTAGVWQLIDSPRKGLLRLAGGAIVVLVIGAWMAASFPVIMHVQGGPNLDFYSTAAPSATLWYLFLALIIGSLFIFPALYYLFKIFKGPDLGLSQIDKESKA